MGKQHCHCLKKKLSLMEYNGHGYIMVITFTIKKKKTNWYTPQKGSSGCFTMATYKLTNPPLFLPLALDTFLSLNKKKTTSSSSSSYWLSKRKKKLSALAPFFFSKPQKKSTLVPDRLLPFKGKEVPLFLSSQ